MISRSEIESLGFEFMNEHEFNEFYKISDYRLANPKKTDQCMIIEMYDYESDRQLSTRLGVLFNGIINNISELELVLKMIRITYDRR